MAEPREGFSTLVRSDHPAVLGAFSSDDYKQSTEQVRAAGRVGVSAENVLALLAGRRENVKKALRVGVSPGVRKTLWISLASFTKAGSVYRSALGDVSQGVPLKCMQQCMWCGHTAVCVCVLAWCLCRRQRAPPPGGIRLAAWHGLPLPAPARGGACSQGACPGCSALHPPPALSLPPPPSPGGTDQQLP